LQRVLTTVTLLGLLVATAAAFAITEHLKLIKSPVYGTLVSKVLSPVCDCSESKASIRIRLRHRDRVTVKILGSGGDTVATVASGAQMPARRHLRFVWDGGTDTGARGPDGVYHAEVHLANAHRTILLPNRILLDTKTPEVLSANRAKPVLFAGPGSSVAIRYTFSEQANAVVYLRGRRIIRGRPTRQHYRVKWTGKLDGRALRAGTYVLSVGALDVAGNQTPPAARKKVTIVVRKTTTITETKKKVTRRMTAVTVPTYPNHTDRSVFINQNALPILKAEALRAQSANINMVSGATDSSNGFEQSLQSAIVKALKA